MAVGVEPRVLRWRPYSGAGLEHASVMPENGGIRVTSVVIGEHEGVAYGARYDLLCDEGWRTRSLAVACLDGRSLRLESDGEGRWTDAAGKSR